MYIKSMVGSGYEIQKVHGDNIFVRNDLMREGETCSDVAFRDIWGSGNEIGEECEGCPLVRVTENISHPCHQNGSRNIIVAYYHNEHEMTVALVCDTVMYIMSDEGKTLDIYRA